MLRARRGAASAYGRMDIPNHLVLHAVPHPDDAVRRVGFTLDHPYLEHCWAPVLGPTSVLLLRRATWLWRTTTSVTIGSEELARGLGLGKGTGRQSPLTRTLDRLAGFGFVVPSRPGEFDVHTEVALLRPRQLEKVPAWTRSVHEHLVTRRLEELRHTDQPAGPTPNPLGRPLHPPRPTRSTGLGLA